MSQTERSIEVRSLINGEWQTAVYQGDDRVTLHSLDWSATLPEIYEKVVLQDVTG